MINPMVLSPEALLSELMELHTDIKNDIGIVALYSEDCEVAQEALPALRRLTTLMERQMETAPEEMYQLYALVKPAHEQLEENIIQALLTCPSTCTCPLRADAVEFVTKRINYRDSKEIRIYGS